MSHSRALFIPVILGTARMGRRSLHAARLVTEELGKCAGVETELIDIARLPLPTNDAGEAIKHAEFSAQIVRPCIQHRGSEKEAVMTDRKLRTLASHRRDACANAIF